MTAPATAVRRSRLLGPALGFVVWSAGFVALYGMQSVGCAFGWDRVAVTGGLTVQRVQLVAILLLLLASLAGLAFFCARQASSRQDARTGRFLHLLTVAGLFAALFASLFTFAPALVLSACNGL